MMIKQKDAVSISCINSFLRRNLKINCSIVETEKKLETVQLIRRLVKKGKWHDYAYVVFVI